MFIPPGNNALTIFVSAIAARTSITSYNNSLETISNAAVTTSSAPVIDATKSLIPWRSVTDNNSNASTILSIAPSSLTKWSTRSSNASLSILLKVALEISKVNNSFNAYSAISWKLLSKTFNLVTTTKICLKWAKVLSVNSIFPSAKFPLL